MTRQDAIEYLEKDIKLHELFNETKHQEKAIKALRMAIEALTKEPEEDCISREWVMNLYKEWQPILATKVYEFGYALKCAPSVVPSCRNTRQVDLISRQDAIDEIHKYFAEEIDKIPTEIDKDGNELYADMPTVNSLLACNKELSKRIKSLPSAEPKRGKWQRFNYSDGDVMECTNCGYRDWRDRWLEDEVHNYCPNCGSYNGGEKHEV